MVSDAKSMLVFAAADCVAVSKTGKIQLLATVGIKCSAGANNISHRVFWSCTLKSYRVLKI